MCVCLPRSACTHSPAHQPAHTIPRGRRTEEGFAIYGEEELGLTKQGGDTAQCPFDCECCY